MGEDNGTYCVVNVVENDWTYGIVDVDEVDETWGAVEFVKQSLPVHPLTHVQLLGAEHSMLVPHKELQIAKFWYYDVQCISISCITYVDSLV